MISENTVKKLSEDVTSLQKDMAQVGTLVDRLDVTIEKLTEVSSTVSQLLAVQGNRLEFQEKVASKLEDLVEKRRQETDTMVKDLHTKIEKVESDTYKDIEANKDKEMSDRIGRLEKWMWTIVGGGAAVGFIVSKVPWDLILK
jgi:uncharacterized coiled-coil protein SlyX